jgi:hypothetical protein
VFFHGLPGYRPRGYCRLCSIFGFTAAPKRYDIRYYLALDDDARLIRNNRADRNDSILREQLKTKLQASSSVRGEKFRLLALAPGASDAAAAGIGDRQGRDSVGREA